ncbi:MAG: multicopper oxidase domain-containing protein [Nitrospinae bacterium]|nr:multicopper oxidase domain-containing protein [Nitrospinota bacterium]
MRKAVLILMAVAFSLGMTAKSEAFKPGLPIKEPRFLLDVSTAGGEAAAIKAGYATRTKGGDKNNPAHMTKGGDWAIAQAKRLGLKMTGETIEYQVTAVEATQEIAGVEFPVWTFVPSNMVKGDKVDENWKNPHGPHPGPTVIANEGDLVRIWMKNRSKNNHTIHIHGPTVIKYDHDGTMNVAQVATKIDQQMIYEFVAFPPGTHIYHCHVNANEHMQMGLDGAIVIHGRKDEKTDQDLLVILMEWDSKFSKEEGFSPTGADSKQSVEVGHPRGLAHYNFFTLNGNAWTDEYPNVIAAMQNTKIRTRFVNFGSWPHNIHLHGHTLHWISWDGRAVGNYTGTISKDYDGEDYAKKDFRSDSVSIIPGERKDYIFEANQDGRWVWHCHIVAHATNDGVYHGGLLQAVVYLHPQPGKNVLEGSGIDLDAYPFGRPTPIGQKAFDQLSDNGTTSNEKVVDNSSNTNSNGSAEY